jgi:hypothetical protein
MISFRTFEVFNMITNQPFISQIRVNDKPTLSYSFLASLPFHHSVTSASIHFGTQPQPHSNLITIGNYDGCIENRPRIPDLVAR